MPALPYDSSQPYDATQPYNGSRTIFDQMQEQLRLVPDTIGQPLRFKRLTSKGNAEPRVYETVWTGFVAVLTARRIRQVFDQELKSYVTQEHATIRINDSLADWHTGDLINDPATDQTWAIGDPDDELISSSGVGTKAFRIMRNLPGLANPRTHGGA